MLATIEVTGPKIPHPRFRSPGSASRKFHAQFKHGQLFEPRTNSSRNKSYPRRSGPGLAFTTPKASRGSEPQ